ncbi:glycogen debranching enzyme GlgX [Leclercia adecarboxylata]|uniref:Glycogen debranching enzyme GlgX n=1 Tax=Leclercia adecarboxylata TaxID=83655 RepID=A0A4U9HV06_9ENTR|nr:glycogen debranching enzyme GlgX [Leclercia adecarboxylata]
MSLAVASWVTTTATVQDSEISWYTGKTSRKAPRRCASSPRHLIELRTSQPLLRRESWRDGMEIQWFNAGGGPQLPEHWDEGTTLGLYLTRPDLHDQPGIWQEVLLLINPYEGRCRSESRNAVRMAGCWS